MIRLTIAAILGGILNDKFIMPHSWLPEGITFANQQEIDGFQQNQPDSFKGLKSANNE